MMAELTAWATARGLFICDTDSLPRIPMLDPTAPTPLRVVAIPRLAAAGRWRVEAMRSISEPMLLWFTKGQGRITVAGVTRGYTNQTAVFVPAGVMHGYEVGAQVFGSAVFFGRGTDIPLPKDPQHLRIKETHAAQEMNVTLDALGREVVSTSPGSERAVRHYAGLIGVWLERQIERAAAENGPPDASRRLVARYAEMLEREFRSGMGVSDYAEALGVTPTHLTRCCRNVSGRPAKALLHDRLIYEARRLLAETDLPVWKIAGSLGFSSPAYFTRAFHQRTGQAPLSFRRTP
jgi:AraC family transcriptional activator of pobA